MENKILKNRNAVRAVIINKDKILLLRKEDHRGIRYALPGGAQDIGESLEQALQRECFEEINTNVDVINLISIVEAHKASSRVEGKRWHQIDFLFNCSVPEDYIPKNGLRPDNGQVAVEWLPVNQLTILTLSLKILPDILNKADFSVSNVYHGMR
ncbi:MAG: NUDIX domain-containing protein [Lentisphaerales bacterium]|nr:NUDIX domain-containing protein [Lentisphaerales bacterium]